jgi:predicted Zn-dependent protease
MPDFFQRLYEETRYYGGNVPEFLLTHPVTESRIADASNRASQYPAAKPAQTTTFEMIKARLLVEQSVDKNELIKELKTQMQDGRTANREASRFAYALALHAGEKNPQAVAELKLLHSEHPERIIYIHTLSQALSSAGEQQEALSYYLKGLRNYPDNPVLTLGAARLQLELGLYEEGRELLNSFTRQHPDNPEGFQLQAEIETRLKNRPAAHLAQAKYYYLNYDTHGAIEQLQLARKEKSDDFYYSSRIDAWLEELKEELALEKAE